MTKKRRKLNKDFEKKIYSSKKSVELVLAKIYDIDDDEIQNEYFRSFNKVVFLFEKLKDDYDSIGFNNDSEKLMANYQNSFILFQSEFEI